jgi:hypothetical protein
VLAGIARLDLDLRIANLLAPNVVTVRLNALPLVMVGNARSDPIGLWIHKSQPWWRLRFEVLTTPFPWPLVLLRCS